ncbi:uncharacterized protein LOC144755060 [Lissotriton helveticus]
MEKKKRRLEAEMENIIQRKKDFEDKMKSFRIPSKPTTVLEEIEEHEEFDAEEPPKTPEPSEQGEEEDLYYTEGDYGDPRSSYDSGSSTAQDLDWQDIEAENPEEAVETYPLRPSPPDDIGAYYEVVQKAAAAYGVKLAEEKGKADFLLETLLPTQTKSFFLPMLKSIMEQGSSKEAFKEPATCRSVTPRTEKKYKFSSQDPPYTQAIVSADSIIAATARRRANVPTTSRPPPDKESRRMDLTGRKIERNAAMHWRMANSNSLLNRHQYQHWDEMNQLLKHLPEEHQQRAAYLVVEGKSIANSCLKTALDGAETSSRLMAIGITERRQAWLRISGFKTEVQNNILNTPFNGETLFGAPVDEKLTQLKKDNETARSMGALQFRGMRRGTPMRRLNGRGGHQQGQPHQEFH